MSENKYFEKALSDMKDNFAGRDGIIHLDDLGYSVREIQKSLDFPFTVEKICRILWDHYLGTDKILLNVPGECSSKGNSKYVKITDRYGKMSFIKVEERPGEGSGEKPGATWNKVVFGNGDGLLCNNAGGENGSLRDFIGEHSGGGPDYVCLGFGRLKAGNPSRWSELLSCLSGNERDYVSSMPWEESGGYVYHILDERMVSILVRLENTGLIPGVYYFASGDV